MDTDQMTLEQLLAEKESLIANPNLNPPELLEQYTQELDKAIEKRRRAPSKPQGHKDEEILYDSSLMD